MMKDKKNWIIIGLVVLFLGYVLISQNPKIITKVKNYIQNLNPLEDSLDVKARARAIVAGQTYLLSLTGEGSDGGGDEKGNICPDCDGLGTVGDSRIRKKCETCEGTGRL